MSQCVLRFGIPIWLATCLAAILISWLAPQFPPGEQVVFVARASGQRQLMIADLSRGLRATLSQPGKMSLNRAFRRIQEKWYRIQSGRRCRAVFFAARRIRTAPTD